MRSQRGTAGAIAVLAGLLWLVSLVGFGAALPAYSHAQHPVALAGAQGIPHALAFNVLALILPGLLAAWSTWQLRSALDGTGWPARIGAHLLLLSALAFAAQGLLPLDVEDLDAASSRLHATAWSLWWISFAPGALLLALRSRAFAVALLLVAIIVIAGTAMLPVGLAQRLGIAGWFALLALAGHWIGRRSTSAADAPASH
ncbi:DUF998 domain-containing protein [Lysobacter korlensis]|uniref:DUF998 domain-containing protein n=1 Tax=Lysobacter korlensis TaxID=553636 RepID=A0ABV6RPS2_9GAMM